MLSKLKKSKTYQKLLFFLIFSFALDSRFSHNNYKSKNIIVASNNQNNNYYSWQPRSVIHGLPNTAASGSGDTGFLIYSDSESDSEISDSSVDFDFDSDFKRLKITFIPNNSSNLNND